MRRECLGAEMLLARERVIEGQLLARTDLASSVDLNAAILQPLFAIRIARVIDEPRAVSANVSVDDDVGRDLEEHTVRRVALRNSPAELGLGDALAGVLHDPFARVDGPRREHASPRDRRRANSKSDYLSHYSLLDASWVGRMVVHQQLPLTETIVAKPNKNSADAKKAAPIRNLPQKDAKSDDRVKGGGVKKTMQTQV